MRKVKLEGESRDLLGRLAPRLELITLFAQVLREVVRRRSEEQRRDAHNSGTACEAWKPSALDSFIS